MTNERYQSLDAMRGMAVMGILLMNIISFSMPSDAYVNPVAYGGTTPADLGSWAAMFVLVDSKMRGLFTVLFGASMLLIYERAQAAGEDGAAVHRKRMIWLLGFGLAHYFFIWWGDILTLYAVCGLAGMFLLLLDEAALKRTAILTIGGNFVLLAGVILLLYGTSADKLNPEDAAADLAIFSGSYWGIIRDRFGENLFDPVATLLMTGLETVGLMAIGMLLLRNGFLTGDWESERYRQTMTRAYLVGIPPSVALAAWLWATGFDPLSMLGAFLVWSMPFRIAVTIGHAALAMLVIRRFARTRLIARVEAAGKAAFTNYIGTSVLMTALFYGYGFGLYGQLSRWQTYFVVLPVWAIILLWSKPWLARFRYGPLEWAWRSLARGKMQSMHS